MGTRAKAMSLFTSDTTGKTLDQCTREVENDFSDYKRERREREDRNRRELEDRRRYS